MEKNWAKDSLYDYAESMSHAAFGWGEEYTEEEFDDYISDCGFEIEEREEDE